MTLGSSMKKDNQPRRLRDLPSEEVEEFKKYLVGKGVPWIEGISREDQDYYWPADYRRWKSGREVWF